MDFFEKVKSKFMKMILFFFCKITFFSLVKNNVLILHHHQQHSECIICWVKFLGNQLIRKCLFSFFTGVFLLVAGGVFVGLFILIIEIIFKRYKERIEEDHEISRTATIHWKKRVEVRI